MKDTLITYGASRSIIKQARLCEVETGGILAGTADPPAILDAGEPGPNAIHEPARYTSDPSMDAACLARSLQRHGEIAGMLGYWHKHPGNMIQPSGGDCYQARQLAREFNDGQPVLIGIVNRNPRGLGYKTTLHLYVVDDGGTPIERPWKLVGIHSRELKAALRQATVTPGTENTDYW